MSNVFKSDLEISREATMLPIKDVAAQINLSEKDLFCYGEYIAKIPALENNSNSKLILVTAISPTRAGEGKTTTTVGLGQALNKIGKKATIALREPSFGPTLGLKGGAAGGGASQVMPMEDINLHFTGDIHAISTANNTIAAMIDNHIFQGNELDFDIKNITWKRAVDINDRALREITIGHGANNGVERKDGFYLSVASEIMAILCLATDLEDLEQKVANIIVGYNKNGEPIRVSQIKAQGAVALILKDAIKPNLVQTLENTPAIIHGGPFANIAHGCNSAIATKSALATSEYVVTEAGFGSDLGAEKFFNIKCRKTGLKPNAVVLVATIRALKMHGGVAAENLNEENVDAVKKGIANLEGHIANLEKFNIPFIVSINDFVNDTKEESQALIDYLENNNILYSFAKIWKDGGNGGIDLANKVVELSKNEAELKFTYENTDSIEEKINKVVKNVYGANGAKFSPEALETMEKLTNLGFGEFPICMAKTPASFSDDPSVIGRPSNFEINITDMYVQAGAEFIVVKTGDIMMMPGLAKEPAAEKMGFDEDGNPKGLF